MALFQQPTIIKGKSQEVSLPPSSFCFPLCQSFLFLPSSLSFLFDFQTPHPMDPNPITVLGDSVVVAMQALNPSTCKTEASGSLWAQANLVYKN